MANTYAQVTANCINTPTTTIVCALALVGAGRSSTSSNKKTVSLHFHLLSTLFYTYISIFHLFTYHV